MIKALENRLHDMELRPIRAASPPSTPRPVLNQRVDEANRREKTAREESSKYKVLLWTSKAELESVKKQLSMGRLQAKIRDERYTISDQSLSQERLENIKHKERIK